MVPNTKPFELDTQCFRLMQPKNCPAACAGVIFLPKLEYKAEKWLLGICSCVNKIETLL